MAENQVKSLEDDAPVARREKRPLRIPRGTLDMAEQWNLLAQPQPALRGFMPPAKAGEVPGPLANPRHMVAHRSKPSPGTGGRGRES